MWRLLGFAAVFVTLGALACGYGAHDAGPCVIDPTDPTETRTSGFAINTRDESYRQFFRWYAASLDVDFGKTTKLTLTIRNKTSKRRTLVTGDVPPAVFTVNPPDCSSSVWNSHWFRDLDHTTYMHFEPGEERTFTGEWNLLVNGFEDMVPSGEYIAHGMVNVYDMEQRHAVKVLAFKRIRVGDRERRVALPEHPPAPVDPDACGEPLRSHASARQELDDHGGTLWHFKDRNGLVIRFFPWKLVDEKRRPTGAFGVRVRVSEPPPEDWDLPKCVGRAPVQAVVDLGR